MLNKIKYKKTIAFGVIIASIVMLTVVFFIPENTNGTINGYSVKINKEVEISQTNGVDYIIVPVNTNLKDITIELDTGDDKISLETLESFMSNLDTLVPQEIEYKSTAEEVDLHMQIIISDDLR